MAILQKKKNIKEHNLNWPEIPDHSHSLLTIGRSGSGKTSLLFNLISHQTNTDKIYLYSKDLHELFINYQLLINKRESPGLKNFYNPNSFIEYSNHMDDIYKNIEERNPNKKQKKN